MITSENCVLIEKNKKLRDEHELAISRVNKEYIYELKEKLDKRDVNILRTIEILKIATTEQLAKILFKDCKFPDKTAQKRMRKLFSYGCVDKFTPRRPMGEGSPQNHYVLARAGAKILDIKGFRAVNKLNQNWRHVVGVSETFANISTAHIIYEWRTEIKLNYMVGSKEEEIRPDVFAQWKVNERDKFAFLEIDMGSEHQSILNKKIDQYHNYFYKSTEFKKHDWQPMKNPIIIPIVFVLNDEKRLQKMQTYYKKYVEKEMSHVQCYFYLFNNLFNN